MDVSTFVAVHDDASVEQAAWEFINMPNVIMLFLGSKPCSSQYDVPIIRCIDYEPDAPNLYDFAGFRVLAKHNLIRTEYSIFLQYDHRVLDDNAAEVLTDMLYENTGMVAFVPAGYDPLNWMLQVPNFKEDFAEAARACRLGRDWSTLDTAVWPTTQGHAWRSSYFYTFMNWAEPGLQAIQDRQYAGHLAERLLTPYCAITHPPQYRTGLFVHESKDVHGTGALMSGNVELFNQRNATFGR